MIDFSVIDLSFQFEWLICFFSLKDCIRLFNLDDWFIFSLIDCVFSIWKINLSFHWLIVSFQSGRLIYLFTDWLCLFSLEDCILIAVGWGGTTKPTEYKNIPMNVSGRHHKPMKSNKVVSSRHVVPHWIYRGYKPTAIKIQSFRLINMITSDTILKHKTILYPIWYWNLKQYYTKYHVEIQNNIASNIMSKSKTILHPISCWNPK